MPSTDRTDNMVTAMIAKSNAGDSADVILWADPTTHRLLVNTSITIDAQFTDDVVFTPATSKGLAIGGEFDDTSPDSVDEGNFGVFRMSSRRELYVQIRDSAGNERGLKVDANGAIAVTGGGGGTQYAEDAVHASGDTGTLALVVRKDTATQLAGTDGDYSVLITDVNGRLHVLDQNSAAILTSLQLIDDTVITDDAAFTPATTKVIMAGFEFNDTTPDSVNEGDAGAARMSSNRNQYVQIRDNAGNERGLNIDASGRLTAILAANSGIDIGDVDVISIIPGTGATNLGKAEDGAHTSGDVGVMLLGVRSDTPNVALAGTDGDYTPLSLYRTGAVRVAPPQEDFAVLGGASVKKYYTSAGAVTDGIIWSPAAGARWYVTDIFINISAAATITVEDDVAAGDVVVWKAELAANSGWSHTFSTPLFSQEDAADLLITTSAGNVYVMCTGYEI